MRKLLVVAALCAVPSLGLAVEMPELAKKSGCTGCHAVDKKVIGPPWAEVGKRYKGDAGAEDRLVEKVKKGGKGNWDALTGGVPMPANYPRVSEEDIRTLVKFELSLGK